MPQFDLDHVSADHIFDQLKLPLPSIRLHCAQIARIRCELEEYHGYHRRYGNTAEKTFRVEVEYEGTSSTPKALPRQNPPPRQVATK